MLSIRIDFKFKLFKDLLYNLRFCKCALYQDPSHCCHVMYAINVNTSI